MPTFSELAQQGLDTKTNLVVKVIQPNKSNNGHKRLYVQFLKTPSDYIPSPKNVD